MKVAIPSLLLLIVNPVFAESPFLRDAQQLTAQRDQAFSAAAVPINRRYKEDLEKLLWRATRANDLDAAIKIREAIGQPPGSAVKPKVRTAEELAAFLDKSVWEIHNGSPDSKVEYTMTFDKSGTFKQSNGSTGALQFTGPRSIKLWNFDPGTLNEDLTEFRAQGNITYFGKLKRQTLSSP